MFDDICCPRQLQAKFLQTFAISDAAKFLLRDIQNCFVAERVKGDDSIKAIEEFWPEEFAHGRFVARVSGCVGFCEADLFRRIGTKI